ncbi:MAG: hypothetical protein QOG10_7170 [Kribbellaceae bacterium]|nr:hypothetical protein [Kribbellaceae bacterium]
MNSLEPEAAKMSTALQPEDRKRGVGCAATGLTSTEVERYYRFDGTCFGFIKIF